MKESKTISIDEGAKSLSAAPKMSADKIVSWLENIYKMVTPYCKKDIKNTFRKFIRKRPKEISIEIAGTIVGSVIDFYSSTSATYLSEEVKQRKEERKDDNREKK